MRKPKLLTERLEIRLSKADRQQLEQHASEAGMQLTEWVRMRLRLDRNSFPQTTNSFPQENTP